MILFDLKMQNGFMASVDGDGAGNVRYNTASDRRLKTNIHAYNSALETLSKIGIYKYHYKANTNIDHVGYIAQELYEHFPYVVSYEEDGPDDPNENPMMLDYGKMTPLNSQAIKELHTELIELQQVVEQLKAENATKGNEIKSLKAELNEKNNLDERIIQLEKALIQLQDHTGINAKVEKE